MATVAQYESRCAVCDQPIHEGDQIEYLETEDEWVHEDCAQEGS